MAFDASPYIAQRGQIISQGIGQMGQAAASLVQQIEQFKDDKKAIEATNKAFEMAESNLRSQLSELGVPPVDREVAVRKVIIKPMEGEKPTDALKRLYSAAPAADAMIEKIRQKRGLDFARKDITQGEMGPPTPGQQYKSPADMTVDDVYAIANKYSVEPSLLEREFNQLKNKTLDKAIAGNPQLDQTAALGAIGAPAEDRAKTLPTMAQNQQNKANVEVAKTNAGAKVEAARLASTSKEEDRTIKEIEIYQKDANTARATVNEITSKIDSLEKQARESVANSGDDNPTQKKLMEEAQKLRDVDLRQAKVAEKAHLAKVDELIKLSIKNSKTAAKMNEVNTIQSQKEIASAKAAIDQVRGYGVELSQLENKKPEDILRFVNGEEKQVALQNAIEDGRNSGKTDWQIINTILYGDENAVSGMPKPSDAITSIPGSGIGTPPNTTPSQPAAPLQPAAGTEFMMKDTPKPIGKPAPTNDWHAAQGSAKTPISGIEKLQKMGLNPKNIKTPDDLAKYLPKEDRPAFLRAMKDTMKTKSFDEIVAKIILKK